jgi:hypothetical protein
MGERKGWKQFIEHLNREKLLSGTSSMLRTAVRHFSASAGRAAGTVQKLSVSEIESAGRQAIEISKAQGIAHRGLVDG